MAHQTSEIKIKVDLDENNVPEQLHWEATDTNEKAAEAKAILMSIWDPKAKETLRINLWTKEMQVDEMKHFFHQTLKPFWSPVGSQHDPPNHPRTCQNHKKVNPNMKNTIF